MSNEFSYVEKPFMLQLKEQGWDIILSEDEKNISEPSLTLRESFDDVIIESRLKDALKKLNDWLTDEQVEEVVSELKRIGLRSSLIEANRQVTNLLIENATVSENTKTGEKSPNVKIIDFENTEENDFLAMNQFRVNTPGTLRTCIIPDIALFINGLPIGIVECKYPSPIGADPMEEGITQLLRYSNTREGVSEREGNERLFHYNQVMISTYFDEARAGTITSGYEYFFQWTDPYPVKADKSLRSQQKLILGMLSRDNLLDLIRNFTIFTNSDEGKLIKILATYTQFRAVKKAINRLLTEKTPEARSGVIWHTQGSGKSFSMVFLIRKLRTIEFLKKLKVVIVTDRTDLETQLSGTAGIAEKAYETKDTKQLIKELKTDSSNLVMVMVQKFLKRASKNEAEEDLPAYEEFPVLNNSDNILILVDEAHRSQGGIFGSNLVYALPRSTKVAFTGTPLITDKAKKKTYEIFGSYIDKYKLNESKDDGVTLQIEYEGKTVNARIKEKGKMEEKFEDMFINKTSKEIAEIKKKYGTKGDILEAEKRIEAISKDIVKHYFDNIFDNGFKAQIVASSRKAAVRYKKYIDKALKEYIEAYENSTSVDKDRLKLMKFLKSVSRITWANNDEPEMIRLAKEAEQMLGPDNVNFKSKFDFKNENSGIAFLIVKDMLLTGFNARIEQVMYIDKRMTDHTLLQAIARVNRVAKGKDVGLVVDYYGIVNHLKEALAAYSEEDIEGALIDIKIELPILKSRYEQLIQLFKDKGVSQISDYVNYRIKKSSEQLEILEQCLAVLEDIKTRADFNVKFKKFLKSIDILLAKSQAREFIPALKAFGHIHARAQYRFRDDSINILGAGQKVKKLIDEHLISVGINTKIKPIEIISTQFEKEISKYQSSRARASEMEHAIRKHCKVNYDKDPVYYRKISEKLEAIIKKYKENWDELARYLSEFTGEVRQGRTEVPAGLDAKKHAPFYDLLVEIVYGKKLPPAETLNRMKELTVKIVDIISKDIDKIDFWKDPHKIKRLRAMIDDELLSVGIPEVYEKKQKIANSFTMLARGAHKELIK